MADEVAQFREQAAAAQERGDSRAANEAYSKELEALQRAANPESAEKAEPDPLSDLLGSAEEDFDDAGDDSEAQEIPFDEIMPEPIPAELTSKVFEDFAKNYGDDQSQLLRSNWGNHALENARLTAALAEDFPAIDQVYGRHQSEDGSLTPEGFVALANAAKDAFGLKSVEDLDKVFPEAETIFWENFDETRGLSPVGFQELLLHAAKQRGYKFKFHRRIK